MRFHLFSLADYPVTKDLVHCAFSPLAYNMAVMAESAGHVETVTPDAGLRCVSMKQFERAVSNIGAISREACRARFERNYTLQAVWPKYEDYFNCGHFFG